MHIVRLLRHYMSSFQNYGGFDYVVGEQVYKYTLEGDTATYYLTENEAGFIGGGWGGALTKGDAVPGVVHYGFAASYAVAKKADFTKADTVYYLTSDQASFINGANISSLMLPKKER